MVSTTVFLIVIASTVAYATDLTGPFERAVETCGRDLQISETRLPTYRSLFFPDDQETHSFIKCILIELRAWTNSRGTIKHSVIQQYFQPDPVDYDYEQRTRRCLEQVLPTHDLNACSKAYWSFICYKDNYGNFVFHVDQFIPPTELQISQYLLDCVDALNIPRDSLIANPHNTSSSTCFSRCFLYRSNIYSDASGLDLDRLYILVGFDAEKAPFIQNARQSLATLNSEQLSDPCQAAIIPERFYKEHLIKILEADGPRDTSFMFESNTL